MAIKLMQQFFQLEAAGSIILLLMTVLALLLANSPLGHIYHAVIGQGLFWINDGLMAVFFLFVGLELKRSLFVEKVAHFSHIFLSAFAALGGMLVPACLYWAFNYSDPVAIKGWSIPVATDIAFALGVLSLFGKRVPIELKLFLLSLAIFDDLGAIIIIAILYSHQLSPVFLLVALGLMGVLCLLNWFSIRWLAPYLLIGIGLWLSFLGAGIHPTLAGVLLAFCIPGDKVKSVSPLHQLEGNLHSWVTYLIMPLFALANAGVNLQGLAWESVLNGIVIGVMLGLFIGKQIGVLGFAWILVRLRIATLPSHTSWLMLYGVAIICGIGFTMSLFLGTLSFEKDGLYYLTQLRLGVMLGSILSGLVGAIVLMLAFYRK